MYISPAPQYENIKVDVVGSKKNVGLIQLNRPKALNALCKPLFVELGKAVNEFDADQSIAAIIITGLYGLHKLNFGLQKGNINEYHLINMFIQN